MTQDRSIPNILRRHWRLLGILIAIGFSGIFLYGVITNHFLSAPILSSRNSAIEMTRELLATTHEYSHGSMPDSIPGYLRGGIRCWEFFQQEMVHGANQYTIAVISEYDSRNSLEPNRDMTEIWLSVDFVDGRHAKVYYYQGGISDCSEVIDQ